MEETSLSLTVYFEEPFWRGLYERRQEGRYEVCKVTYGAEPKDGQIYAMILGDWAQLVFVPSEPAESKRLGKNPKRRKRQVAKDLKKPALGTKAQQALKAWQKQQADEQKKAAHQREEASQAERFAKKQAKRKARRKGQ